MQNIQVIIGYMFGIEGDIKMTREDAIYLLNCIVTDNPYDKDAIN